MNINRIIMSGNLTKDPELRTSQSGANVLLFRIASNERRKNPSTGEWEDYPNFVDCALAGSRAEGLSKRLSKGVKVAVEGRLRFSQWESGGQRRSKHEIVVSEIDFISQQDGKPSRKGADPYADLAYDEVLDDDIAF